MDAEKQDETAGAFDFTSSSAIPAIRLTAQDAIARQARRGSVTLLLVAGLQLIFVVLFTLQLIRSNLWLNDLKGRGYDPSQLSMHWLVYFSYGLAVLLGVLFLALGIWARKDPLLAACIGLGVYVGVNVLDLIWLFAFGLEVLPGGCLSLPVVCLIVVLLIDAIRASLVYRRLVNKLIVEIRPPASEQ
jgi:hypothetical protein